MQEREKEETISHSQNIYQFPSRVPSKFCLFSRVFCFIGRYPMICLSSTYPPPPDYWIFKEGEGFFIHPPSLFLKKKKIRGGGFSALQTIHWKAPFIVISKLLAPPPSLSIWINNSLTAKYYTIFQIFGFKNFRTLSVCWHHLLSPLFVHSIKGYRGHEGARLG